MEGDAGIDAPFRSGTFPHGFNFPESQYGKLRRVDLGLNGLGHLGNIGNAKGRGVVGRRKAARMKINKCHDSPPVQAG
jgi:hypothetical protein